MKYFYLVFSISAFLYSALLKIIGQLLLKNDFTTQLYIGILVPSLFFLFSGVYHKINVHKEGGTLLINAVSEVSLFVLMVASFTLVAIMYA